ncbi:MAG: metal-sensing transcriptional repressor [Ancrocorticia sp.]
MGDQVVSEGFEYHSGEACASGRCPACSAARALLEDTLIPEALEMSTSRILSAGERVKVKNRIARAQGQLSGIIRMFEADVPVPEIAIQMRAAFHAVRRTVVRLLVLGVEEQTMASEGDVPDIFSYGFPLIGGMNSTRFVDSNKVLDNLRIAQHSLASAQVLLEDDDSFLKMVAVLAVSAGRIRETSVSLFLEKLMAARRENSIADCRLYEKLIMSY